MSRWLGFNDLLARYAEQGSDVALLGHGMVKALRCIPLERNVEVRGPFVHSMIERTASTAVCVGTSESNQPESNVSRELPDIRKLYMSATFDPFPSAILKILQQNKKEPKDFWNQLSRPSVSCDDNLSLRVWPIGNP